MKPFAFRQRVGHINWKAISSVDIESVVDDNQIEELQSIVDEVAFCEVKTADVKGTGVHDLKRFIHLMQLMIEYLLYCQESQLQLVHEMHGRNSSLKKKNKELMRKVESSKEDVRIYRRQISVLKNSIDKYKAMVKKNEGYVELPPRAFNAIEHENVPKQENAVESVAPIVESMLRHERQTREFVRDMIDEQRTTLLRELGRMHSSPGERREGSLSMESRVDVHSHRRRDSEASERDTRNLSEREEKLRVKERELLDREHDLNMKIKQLAAHKPSSPHRPSRPIVATHSVGVNTPPMAESSASGSSLDKGISLAFNVMSRTHNKSAQDCKMYAFKVWKNALLKCQENSRLKMESDLQAARNEVMMLEEKVTILVARLETEKEQHSLLKEKHEEISHHISTMDREPSFRANQGTGVGMGHEAGGYTGPSEEQLLEVALQRVQKHVIEASPEDVLDTLADEILSRMEVGDEASSQESSYQHDRTHQ